ncbi:hypothetical protein F7734_28735 [Scytonema sp. UIC 10036]|uniref:hypothetical protein n=1 Tax=Scytonema sp. UIC 10036 TaxID=2304196 RepID=UPI0012DAD466|nr:hypothetical protein [Scytonema sp. UIC 10036]MUG96111.1 hypothetical protein [Scytonema sp. UIC 10036]
MKNSNFIKESTGMASYKIIILGPRRSGKTVFLASMYRRLSIPGQFKIFLECDSSPIVINPTDGREMSPSQLLAERYANLANPNKDWEPGTVDVEKWHFTCKVQRPDLDFKDFTACNFTYLDYAGGDLVLQQNPELDRELQEADSLLGLLDGEKILSLLRNEGDGYTQITQDLGNMLPILMRKKNPVHFVISKWDLLHRDFSLEQVRDRLLEEEFFRDFVQNRIDGNSSVRLIPMSAVGMEFVKLEDGIMKKIPGKSLKPFQVEMPLACVLPDKVKFELEQVAKKKQELLNQQINYSSQVGFWDSLLEFAGTAIDWFRQSIVADLPLELRFTDEILKKFSAAARAGAQQTREQQENRIRELEYQRNKSLKSVTDEESALKYTIDVFLEMQAKLDYSFPDSLIKLPKNSSRLYN